MDPNIQNLFEPQGDESTVGNADVMQLSDDPNSWPAEIMNAMLASLALPPGAVPTISVQPEDESGNASGAVTIDLAGQQYVIPLVIRDGALFPMDVFYPVGNEDAMRPLDSSTFFSQTVADTSSMQQIPKQTAAGGSLVDAPAGDQMGQPDAVGLDNLRGPDGNGPMTDKMASVMGMVEDQLWVAPGVIKKVASELHEGGVVKEFGAKFPKLADSVMRLMRRQSDVYESHSDCGCTTIDCMHAAKPDAAEAFAFDELRLGATDVYQVRSMGPGRYRMFATLSRVYVPFVMDLSSQGVRDLFTSLFSRFAMRERHDVGAHVNQLMSQLRVTGEVTIAAPTQAGRLKSALLRRPAATEITTYGRYCVMQEGGLLDRGLAFVNVFDLDGGPVPGVVWVSERGTSWSMQESAVGIMEGSAPNFTEIGGWSGWEDGRRGFLAWPGPDGSVCLSVPVTINSREVMSGAESVLLVRGTLGVEERLILDDGISHPMAAAGADAIDSSGRNVYYMPKQTLFLPVTARMVHLATTAASFDKTATPVVKSSIMKNGAGGYVVKLEAYKSATPRGPMRSCSLLPAALAVTLQSRS
jgi:hypothetical protein